jgi:hypothetical protein
MVVNVDKSSLGPLRQGAHTQSCHTHSVSHYASLSARFRLLILAPLALFLVWEVITRSLVAYLSDANPELAVRLRSNYPTAVLNIAQATLSRDPSLKNVEPVEPLPRDDSSRLTVVAKGTQSAKSIDPTVRPEPLAGDSALSTAIDSPAMAQIRTWAEQALLEDPLNARALRILGQLSRGSSKAVFMQAAARRSLLESEAVFWLMRENYEDGDYRSAAHYADLLLRTRPSSHNAVQAAMAILAKIAEKPAMSGELKQLLASNPLWRSHFFSVLPGNISNATTPLDLLLALRDTPTPPKTSEIGPYLKFLIEHKLYDLAYYSWLQFLSPAQLNKVGLLFNGSFEVNPASLPFDWTFVADSGATIEIADRTDGRGEQALFLEFGGGRVEGLSVSQMVLLAPGDYQFRGTYMADILSQRGLQWRVACAGKSWRVIGESPIVIEAKSDWRDFEFSFTVPTNDCPLQSVQLVFTARSASEQFISGSTWFDDLRIVREKIADG